jgi:hypothetical protein
MAGAVVKLDEIMVGMMPERLETTTTIPETSLA